MRLHRPLEIRSVASLHASQKLGPDSEERAAKRGRRGGVATEASERIFYVTSIGPTSCTKTIGEMLEVSTPTARNLLKQTKLRGRMMHPPPTGTGSQQDEAFCLWVK